MAHRHTGVGHWLQGFEMKLPSTFWCLDASIISVCLPGSAVQRVAKAIINTSAPCCTFEMQPSLISTFHTSFCINSLNLINNPSLSHRDYSSTRVLRQIWATLNKHCNITGLKYFPSFKLTIRLVNIKWGVWYHRTLYITVNMVLFMFGHVYTQKSM